MSTQVLGSKIDALVKYAEFNRFGYMAFTLIFLGCLGGVVLGLGGIKSDAVLITTIAFNMLATVFMIALAPIKWVLASSFVATILNLLFIAYFIIAG